MRCEIDEKAANDGAGAPQAANLWGGPGHFSAPQQTGRDSPGAGEIAFLEHPDRVLRRDGHPRARSLHRLQDGPAPCYAAAVRDPVDRGVRGQAWLERGAARATLGRVGQSAPSFTSGASRFPVEWTPPPGDYYYLDTAPPGTYAPVGYLVPTKAAVATKCSNDTGLQPSM
ncbi:hypothetical protein NDU88_003640 [Pleurodeles waltl]|uniref:Uncharacterized protein n=1 Tax=Pleurodeles waltl TaxID=8319 RepID=A0AAV7TQA5_PLEWA|nr:hypothetical protein NDU88_003640 [Pleurodeles waltl]